MTRARIKKLEARLLAERRYLNASVQAANERARQDERAGEDEVLGPGYGAEDAGAIVARELEALVAERERRELEAVDAALRVLYQHPDRYGRCVQCGGQIPMRRLELVPWTQRCEAHQQGSELARRAS